MHPPRSSAAAIHAVESSTTPKKCTTASRLSLWWRGCLPNWGLPPCPIRMGRCGVEEHQRIGSQDINPTTVRIVKLTVNGCNPGPQSYRADQTAGIGTIVFHLTSTTTDALTSSAPKVLN